MLLQTRPLGWMTCLKLNQCWNWQNHKIILISMIWFDIRCLKYYQFYSVTSRVIHLALHALVHYVTSVPLFHSLQNLSFVNLYILGFATCSVTDECWGLKEKYFCFLFHRSKKLGTGRGNKFFIKYFYSYRLWF